MVDFLDKPAYSLKDLEKLIEYLRGPDGCPWDREQTHESIRRNLLEEAYEAAQEIDSGDTQNLIEELGDVLMQVVFHAVIAKEDGRFDLDTIADVTCKKLIRRHPHVFGDFKAEDGAQSLVFWEDMKRKEKLHDSTADAMRSVPKSLPELWRAEKIQKKAAKVGFDWPDHTGAVGALQSELAELQEAISSGDGIEEELGDILFSVVNVARFFDLDPEQALGSASDKFISRFEKLERQAKSQGDKLEDMTLDQMEALYQKAKLEE